MAIKDILKLGSYPCTAYQASNGTERKLITFRQTCQCAGAVDNQGQAGLLQSSRPSYLPNAEPPDTAQTM